MIDEYLGVAQAAYNQRVELIRSRLRPFWLRHRYTARTAQYAIRISILLAPVPFLADLWFRSSQGPTDGQMLLFVGSILGSCTIAFVIAEVHSLITVDDGDTE